MEMVLRRIKWQSAIDFETYGSSLAESFIFFPLSLPVGAL
jgi:hypothetical protein